MFNVFKTLVRQKKEFLFVVVVFLWFVAQMTYFATNIKYGIPPDEHYHLKVSQEYKNLNGIFIEEKPETYKFGTLSKTYYLYHLVMGKLLNLNVFNIDEYLFLRVLNIIIGLIAVFFAYLLVKEVTDDSVVRVVSLALYTNTLMFVFLSSSINYDNLANLFSLLLVFYYVRLVKTKNLLDLLKVVLFFLIGSLIKISVAPIIIALFVLTFFMFSLEDAKKILSNKIKTTTVVLFLLIGVFLSLNIKLYVGNLVNYGSFMPPAISSVLKSQGLPEYKTKNQQIYEGFFATAQTRTRMSFHNFATEAAVFLERGSFGIFAHKTMLKKNLLVYHLLFVASLIALLSNIKLLLNNKSLLVVFSVFVFYFIFVIIEKYLSYIKMNIFGAGLQGRYLFPVLMCFYIVFASFLLCRLPNKIKIIVGCLVSCFFLYGSFVFFLKNVSPQWLI